MRRPRPRLRSLLLLAPVIAGCMLADPMPVPLDLEEDPDEPIPLQPVLTPGEITERRRARLQNDLRSQEATRAEEVLCPPVAYPSQDVPLHAGTTFERIAAEQPRADSITLAEHPVKLPGVRFYRVWSGGGACLYGWWSTGCFIDDQAVYCGEHDSTDALEAFIEAHGLDEHPERLSEDGWMHLVATLAGASRILASPDLPGTCLDAPPASIAQRLLTHVHSSDGHLRLSVPLDTSTRLLGPGDVVLVDVEIDDGEVQVSQTMLWRLEDRERYWERRQRSQYRE